MGIMKLRLLAAPTVALVLAGTACHTDKNQAKLPAPQANAPAMSAAAPAPAAQASPDPKPIPPTEAQATLQPKPDPVTELIAKAEGEYQAGEEKFKAGDLEASKRSFDRAMDVLLQSPAELRSDERVQHELERVLESV